MPTDPDDRTGLWLGSMVEEAAAAHPDGLLVVDHGLDVLPDAPRAFTVAELAGHIADLSARLWAAGVRAGDHVALHKSANFDLYLLACAAARIGAVPAMLSPALDADTVQRLLARLGRPHLLTDTGKLTGDLAGLPLDELADRVLVTAGAHPGAVSLADLAGAPAVSAVRTAPDSAALMTHTSGTTGTPKLVVHTARSLLGRLRPQERLANAFREPERTLIHVSFVHSRLFLALAVLLPRGMPAIVVREGDAEHVARICAELRPGLIETHPNSFMEWEPLASDPRRPFAGVKYFSSTFDAIHPGTIQHLLAASDRRMPLFYQIYGQSECGPLAGRAYTRHGAENIDGRCLGHPMPGTSEIRVVSRGGEEPGPDTPGHIEVRTPGRALTYYGEDERYREQLTDGWWRMGDVGYLTDQGCVHLLDREVDLIPALRSTLEAEDTVLARLPELTELVFVPGARQEPVPVVCTAADRPLDPGRWRAAVRDLPAALAPPVQMKLDELPRTATSKIKRRELAARLQAGRAA
ncbi:class I adenylate-forming enzyme family protein [Streptomyces luteolus]|uniref:AMP-binding protein n=1 Tax=Streptomyces luteolus TaxID=3043615 RepID=A0ABT6T4Y0_9ACTN|nr:AMP-binding protein [Streptomyces sp. B-S-A12]MDI3422938.1 AMP-binding protein [Streptomyces sp. B-S-A12]